MTTIYWQIGGGVAALFVAFGVFKMIENRGAVKAVAAIERKDVANVKKAERAADKSRSPDGRGVRDPYTRRDE